jgi:hypothetical protein
MKYAIARQVAMDAIALPKTVKEIILKIARATAVIVATAPAISSVLVENLLLIGGFTGCTGNAEV